MVQVLLVLHVPVIWQRWDMMLLFLRLFMSQVEYLYMVFLNSVFLRRLLWQVR